MSISYCPDCEEIVEGRTEYVFDSEAGCEVCICGGCGADTTELSEDDPKDERP